MSSYSVSADEGSAHYTRRTQLHDALVGRPLGTVANLILRLVNGAAFGACALALFLLFMAAALAAGTTTPAMDLWMGRMLAALSVGAVAFLRVVWQLAKRDRWPWGWRLLAVLAVVAVALLWLSAPPGINSPRPGA
jgi:hypothetical protein